MTRLRTTTPGQTRAERDETIRRAYAADPREETRALLMAKHRLGIRAMRRILQTAQRPQKVAV